MVNGIIRNAFSPQAPPLPLSLPKSRLIEKWAIFARRYRHSIVVTMSSLKDELNARCSIVNIEN